ncbi:hypothetical protein PUR34_04505 [Streptomyces sp. JV185]|nr:hypothetical protein [Streptomyces sp. JV185]MEE1767458.1 hypothetical protein [Streptomyces sp. JV185]
MVVALVDRRHQFEYGVEVELAAAPGIPFVGADAGAQLPGRCQQGQFGGITHGAAGGVQLCVVAPCHHRRESPQRLVIGQPPLAAVSASSR